MPESNTGKPDKKVSEYRQQLQGRVPLKTLAPEHFESLLRDIQFIDVPAGRVIFKQGEKDNRTVYLMSGEILLSSTSEPDVTIKSEARQAQHPVGNFQPRKQTATTSVASTIAHVDSDLLDLMLTWDQGSSYEVQEIEQAQDSDWMTVLLRSHALSQLPAANLQALFLRVEAMSVEAGQVVITEGEEGDYYYIISHGRCRVTRSSKKGGQALELAELASGDSFGEEALISDEHRNATVTMLTDGMLMRLAKKDFLELLNAPVLNWLDREQADGVAAEGGMFIDVRTPGEFSEGNLPDSVNIPLMFLRDKAESLDKSRRYVMVCDTGRRSSTAAFLLSGRGFDVAVLKDGLSVAGSGA